MTGLRGAGSDAIGSQQAAVHAGRASPGGENRTPHVLSPEVPDREQVQVRAQTNVEVQRCQILGIHPAVLEGVMLSSGRTHFCVCLARDTADLPVAAEQVRPVTLQLSLSKFQLKPSLGKPRYHRACHTLCLSPASGARASPTTRRPEHTLIKPTGSRAWRGPNQLCARCHTNAPTAPPPPTLVGHTSIRGNGAILHSVSIVGRRSRC
ncbi:hypothetical protein BT67DRAFT_185602 [Trichocladium antarcticum]|uniref:Uncharacterized protein n=1 Tax=Trichocladium antarcticum TaxID=1450529 RepID=A0AAN6ZG58_9PEZI|nr:hypothetical protein BT67DRAFT_185602 [Trichocladium antarcticum]